MNHALTFVTSKNYCDFAFSAPVVNFTAGLFGGAVDTDLMLSPHFLQYQWL